MRYAWLIVVFVGMVSIVSLTCEGVEVEPQTKWHVMTAHKYPDGLQLRIVTTHTLMLHCIATNERGWPVTSGHFQATKTTSTHKLNTEGDLVYLIENVECYRTWEI